MAVELLVRKFDGTGGREKDQIVDTRPFPNKAYGAFEKTGMSQRFYRVVITDKEFDSVKGVFKRHVPVLLDKNGIPIKTLRSSHKINELTLNSSDLAAIETKQRVLKTYLSLGLINAIDNSVVTK